MLTATINWNDDAHVAWLHIASSSSRPQVSPVTDTMPRCWQFLEPSAVWRQADTSRSAEDSASSCRTASKKLSRAAGSSPSSISMTCNSAKASSMTLWRAGRGTDSSSGLRVVAPRALLSKKMAVSLLIWGVYGLR